MKKENRDGLKKEPATKFDSDKLRTDLISVPALKGMVKVLNHGVEKYGERNWEKGMSWSRCYGATLRHLLTFWEGEDIDPESGLSHLDHAACCIHFLQHYFKTSIGKDDRPEIKRLSNE